MKKATVLTVVAMIFSLTPDVFAQGSGIELGVGARAMAFANNHTAAANDISAVYWNPAALAFLPVREVTMSFDGMRINGASEILGDGLSIPHNAKLSDNRDRLRMSGIGVMTAMPTVRGGLTLAASFDRPYIFDDFTVYTYKNGGDATKVDARRYGDLNRWSGAFGVQVAPKISIGLTFSVVNGIEKAPVFHEIRSDDPNYNFYSDPYLVNYYDVEFQNKYLGYALTVGALCFPLDNLKVGVKINAVDNVNFVETQYYKVTPESKRVQSPTNEKGRAYRSPLGALGAEWTLPWLTAALDLRATLPYTFILPSEDVDIMPDGVQARDFKVGFGVGLEAPLPNVPVVLRAGYSFDDYDLFPIIHKFEGDRVAWDEILGEETSWRADRNRHTVAAGVGIFTSGVGFELSYAYQTWGIATDAADVLFKEKYSSHRFMTAIIYRY